MIGGLRFLGLCSFLFLAVQGCGISTHIEIAERAQEFLDITLGGVNYRELINKHPDAYQAGSSYPDAYYPDICYNGVYHAVAEDTHWTPFLKAAVDYIRDTYPKPWDESVEKLVVFLMAIVQHQVSDATWHSLGISQGFLRAMAAVNYHGSFNAAHNDGDFGGDVVNIFSLDMDYIGLIDKWYVPTQDLLNIYTEMYGTPDRMTEEVVENCTLLLFLGRLGENIGVIDLLYPTYAERSPFLIDHLNGYYLGGMDDMSTWSANVMVHTATMLEHGTDVCDLPNNPIYIECEDPPAHPVHPPLTQSNPGLSAEWNSHTASLHVNTQDVIIERSHQGMVFSASHDIQETLTTSKQASVSLNQHLPDAVYYTTDKYARLGTSLLAADMNSDGYDDLIIGAPGTGVPGNPEQGAVYIIYGNESGVPQVNDSIHDLADVVLHGSVLNGRFGHALSVVDLNADGVNDLAVSAPSAGADSLQYHGAVYVYFGDEVHKRFNDIPDITYVCGETYCNFGWSLSSGDLDGDGFGDLVVGSPFSPGPGEQRGSISVLHSGNQYTGLNYITTRDTHQSTIYGEQDYEWLGYSVSVGQTSNGSTTLAAGAPTHRVCAREDCGFDQDDLQAVGSVSLYSDDLSPLTSLVGSQVFGQLGSTVVVGQYGGQDVVAISSPTAGVASRNLTQSGMVELYPLTELGIIAGPLLTLYGDKPYARFGSKVLITDVNRDGDNDVVVSASFWSETILQNREAGILYVFYGGVDEDKRHADEADEVLSIGETRARYGTSLAAFNSDDQVQLVSGATHSSDTARLAGRIAIHLL